MSRSQPAWSTRDAHLYACCSATALALAGIMLTICDDLRAQSTPPVIAQENQGLTGHISQAVNAGRPQTGFEHGLSFYTSVYTLNPEPAAGTQLGWGTWFMPNNRSFTEPLCPVGTLARDNWPERGPTFRDVYQNIEGGMGQWVSTRFPSSSPKYRVNSTPDCYNTQVSSTGWNFGGALLSSDKLGLAQLSNRLLLAPDGITFEAASNPGVLGNAWIALPLIPSYTPSSGVPTGDQSWTLFLHAANFQGAVAFFTNEMWSAINAVDRTGVGRGHDARPAEAGGVALEMGTTPMFTARDATGARFRRIPRLTFPLNSNTEAVLIRDLRHYSKQAIWNGVAAWMAAGTVATQFDARGIYRLTLDGTHIGLTLGGRPVVTDSSFTAVAVATPGGPAFGLRWAGGMEPGVFPEYFKENGDRWTPIPAAQVPGETWLVEQRFAPGPRLTYPGLDQSSASPWVPSKWQAGPFTVSFNDGSIVEYVWFKFIDQPAIARLGLDDDSRNRLQAFVESFHEVFSLSGLSIPPPSSGALATVDSALFVSPPMGLERGYVPIVIRQH